jgi:hypothetical protein
MALHAERHRVPLQPQTLLYYYRLPDEATHLRLHLALRWGWADAPPGQAYALLRSLQESFAPHFRPTLQQTPDWSLLTFVVEAVQRDAFYAEVVARLQSFALDEQAVSPLLERVQTELRQAQDQLSTRIQRAVAQEAFAGTAYAQGPLPAAPLEAGNLVALTQTLLPQVPVYLRLEDSLPLLPILAAFAGLSQMAVAPEPLAPWPAPETLAEPISLEIPVEGGWVVQAFRWPGLLEDPWVYGWLAQQWLEQVLTVFPPEAPIDRLEIRWTPWLRGSLLTLTGHVARADEAEMGKSALLRWILACREQFLTVRRLHRAVTALHTQWVGAQYPLGEIPLPVLLDELSHGASRLKGRLQQVALPDLREALAQALTQDQLVSLECLPPQTHKRRDPHPQLLPAALARPSVAAAPVPARPSFLTAPQRLTLGAWQAHLIPRDLPQSVCVGAWFPGGSHQDPVPGSTWILFAMLADHFRQHVQRGEARGAHPDPEAFQWHVGRDVCWFYWTAPVQEYTAALELLKLLVGYARFERPHFERFKTEALAHTQRQVLDVQPHAARHFCHSGFGNHPYGPPCEGDYTAIQQVTPEDVQECQQRLFAKGQWFPLILGNIIPHAGEWLQRTLQILPAPPAREAEPDERPIRPRRGEVILKRAVTQHLSLEGRIFPAILPPEQLPLATLVFQWLHEEIQQAYGLGSGASFDPLQMAWMFQLWGPWQHDFPARWERWCADGPSDLEGLKRRVCVQQQLPHGVSEFWQGYTRWEAFGPGSEAWFNLADTLAPLTREDVQQFCAEYLGDRQEWLSIRARPGGAS